MTKKDDNINAQLNKMTIIRICSSLQGFVLADKINKFFSFDMQKGNNFPFQDADSLNMKYECFSSYISKYRTTLLLIDNRAMNGDKKLIGNSESTDYLFIVIGRDHNIISQQFLSALEDTTGDTQANLQQEGFAITLISKIRGVNLLSTNIIYPSSSKNPIVKKGVLDDIARYKENLLLHFEEM
ncbi:MAG: hypothetical protein LBO06_01905 [Bacteroidales bacterium]|jgi:hypothetical protein|nr:hypothetical protein [Bacteroidales bacterium]